MFQPMLEIKREQVQHLLKGKQNPLILSKIVQPGEKFKFLVITILLSI